jgi:hypothetical protein
MLSSKSNLKAIIGDFHLDRMMHYSVFVPRLFISPREGQGKGHQDSRLHAAGKGCSCCIT